MKRSLLSIFLLALPAWGAGNARLSFGPPARFESLRWAPEVSPDFYLISPEGGEWEKIYLAPAPPPTGKEVCNANYPAPLSAPVDLDGTSPPYALSANTNYRLTGTISTAGAAFTLPTTGADRNDIGIDANGRDVTAQPIFNCNGCDPNNIVIQSSVASVVDGTRCPVWTSTGNIGLGFESTHAFSAKGTIRNLAIVVSGTSTTASKQGIKLDWHQTTNAEPASESFLLERVEIYMPAACTVAGCRETAFQPTNISRVKVNNSYLEIPVGNIEGQGVALYNGNYLTVSNSTIKNFASRNIIMDTLDVPVTGTITRTGGSITVNTTRSHKFYVGASGSLRGCGDSTFQAPSFFTVASTPSNTQFVATQSGGNASTTCTAAMAASRGGSFTSNTLENGRLRLRDTNLFTVTGNDFSNISGSSPRAIDLDTGNLFGLNQPEFDGVIHDSVISGNTIHFTGTGGEGILIRGNKCTDGSPSATDGNCKIQSMTVTGTNGKFATVTAIFGQSAQLTVENTTGASSLSTASTVSGSGSELNVCPTGSLGTPTTSSGGVVNSYDTCGAAPAVTLNPVSLGAPNTVVGNSSPPNPPFPSNTVTIKNSGTATLNITSVALVTGTQFSLVHDCGATLAAGAFCTGTITFTPTSCGAGCPIIYNDTLRVVSDAPSSPNDATVSGTAVTATTVPTMPGPAVKPLAYSCPALARSSLRCSLDVVGLPRGIVNVKVLLTLLDGTVRESRIAPVELY